MGPDANPRIIELASLIYPGGVVGKRARSVAIASHPSAWQLLTPGG